MPLIPRKFLILLSILLCRANAFAQDVQGMHKNECLCYLSDTSGKSHKTFKGLTITTFEAKDTNLEKKELQQSTFTLFNHMGQKLLEIEKDELGKVTDSTRYLYDTKGNLVKSLSYSSKDDTMGRMVFSGIEMKEYDDDDNLIRDSTWSGNVAFCDDYNTVGDEVRLVEYAQNDSTKKMEIYSLQTIMYDNQNRVIKNYSWVHQFGRRNMGYDANDETRWIDTDIQESTKYKEYDTQGNSIKEYEIEYGDTSSLRIVTFDDKNRRTGIKGFDEVGKPSTSVFIYDSAGREVRHIFINTNYYNRKKMDTLIINTKYDKMSRKIEMYDTNVDGIWVDKWSYRQDGSFDFSKKVYGPDKGNQNKLYLNDRMVSHFNKDSIEVSYIDTMWSTFGRNVEISRKYFNEEGKVTCDSVFDTAKSKMNYSTSLSVYSYKYDSKGRETEEKYVSGDNAYNHKEIWGYNEDGILVWHLYYSTCDTKPDNLSAKHYYRDGKNLKDERESNPNRTSIKRYALNSRITEELEWDNKGKTTQTLYQYQDW